MVLEKSKDQKINALIRSKMKPIKSNNPVAATDDLDFGLASTPAPKKDTESVPVPAKSEPSDEYDSLFNDL
jgi:hypothetical protein